MSDTLFAFDLDGTVTACELLPYIAAACGIDAPMRELTRKALLGEMDYARSLAERFRLLRHIPPARVRAIVAAAPLHRDIVDFITERKEYCAIITSNIDVWIAPITSRLGCRAFTSTTVTDAGRLRLTDVTDKAAAVDALRAEHAARTGRPVETVRVVAVGESVNDIPLLERADVGIAFGGVHAPAPDLLAVAHRRVDAEAELCALLRDSCG